MWDIQIQMDAIKTLKRLSKEASKSVFLFLNDYIPKDLSPTHLQDSKIKELKGIYRFPKETPDGKIHLFLHIDFSTKVIKVLHVGGRHLLKRKKRSHRP